MKILLLTDNQDLYYLLNTMIIRKSPDNKCIVSDFSEKNIKSHIEQFNELGSCIMYSDSENNFTIGNVATLSSICGCLASAQVPTYTNLNCIKNNKLFPENSIISVTDINDLTNKFQNDFTDLIKVSTMRLAKRKLFLKGIPFTADCFGQFIAKNKLDIVQTFLAGGMSVNSKDDTGTPMLNIACRNDNFNFVKMLITLGADINAVSEDRGYTAIMDAVWRGNEKITQYLIDNCAELNTINKEGQTNLILAVGANRVNIVKLLVENGANPDFKDMMGMSAYNYATLFKKEALIELLKPYHKE